MKQNKLSLNFSRFQNYLSLLEGKTNSSTDFSNPMGNCLLDVADYGEEPEVAKNVKQWNVRNTKIPLATDLYQNKMK